MNETKIRQLYIFDDMSFKFIDRPLENSCIIEKDKGQDKIKRAWKHFFSNEFYFQGYKNISAGPVTPSFSRDIILDPFNKVPVGDGTEMNKKPTDKTMKTWISKVAENMRHIHRAKRTKSQVIQPIEWALIGVLSLETIAWLARFAWG